MEREVGRWLWPSFDGLHRLRSCFVFSMTICAGSRMMHCMYPARSGIRIDPKFAIAASTAIGGYCYVCSYRMRFVSTNEIHISTA